ncbi:hypothetical protein [Paenibacillus jamilae]|uniref:hypothetical protein n=1 Tax=Paenibacillus jamilae TaxID=114136 RepID=UPI000AD2EF16|nr:hypothetical protein [Paenibacillus jamilae]
MSEGNKVLDCRSASPGGSPHKKKDHSSEGTGEVSEVWLNPKWKWGSLKSTPTYGHTFSEHGAKKKQISL